MKLTSSIQIHIILLFTATTKSWFFKLVTYQKQCKIFCVGANQFKPQKILSYLQFLYYFTDENLNIERLRIFQVHTKNIWWSRNLKPIHLSPILYHFSSQDNLLNYLLQNAYTHLLNVYSVPSPGDNHLKQHVHL